MLRAGVTLPSLAAGSRETSPGGERLGSYPAPLAVLGLSIALTLGLPTGMQDMPGIPMAGGWLLSPIWTPICGGSWLGSATDFLGMWGAMTAAMMSPSLTLELRRLRQGNGIGRAPYSPGNALCVAFAYFAVWMGAGAGIFLGGAAFSTAVLADVHLSRAVPELTELFVLVAALFQLSPFKARQLARCHASGRPGEFTPMLLGLRLGWRCVLSCGGVTTMLLIAGIMDPRAMALATLAITAERLAPAGRLFAQGTGAAALVGGLAMIATPT